MSVQIKTPRYYRVGLLLLVALCATWLTYVVFSQISVNGAYGPFADEGLMTSGAERVLQGQIPHRNFLSIVGGTAYYPLAGWFAVFGDSYTSLRLCTLLASYLLIALILWCAWPVLKFWSGAAVFIFSVFLFPVWPFTSYHWWFLIPALLSTGIILRPRTPHRLLLAGVIAGLLTSMVFNKTGSLIVGHTLALWFAYSHHPERIRNLIHYLVGALVGIVAGFLPILLIGSLSEYVREVVVNNFLYYGGSVPGNFAALNGMAIMMILVTIFLALPLFRENFFSSDRRHQYITVMSTAICLFFSTIFFLEPIHYGFVTIFAVVAMLMIAMIAAERLLLAHQQKKRYRYSTFTISLVFIAGASHAFLFGVMLYNPLRFPVMPTAGLMVTKKGSLGLNARWNKTRELLTVGDLLNGPMARQSIFIAGFAPGLYYFYGLQNPTSFEHLPTEAMAPEDRKRLERELARNVDVIMYLPHSWWLLTPEGETMTFVADHFPNRYAYSNGSVQIFSKKPLTYLPPI